MREPSEAGSWKIGRADAKGEWEIGDARWDAEGREFYTVKLRERSSHMGAESREPSALARRSGTRGRVGHSSTQPQSGYTTKPRVALAHPGSTVRITHSQPQSGCTTKRHSIVCNGIAPIRCKTSLRFVCGHLSRPQGALRATLGFVVHRLRRNQTHAQPLARQRGSSSARAGFDLRSPISELRASSFQLRNPRVLALWSTVIHHRCRLHHARP